MEEQKIVVAGVIHHEGKFLMLKRSNHENFFPNKWELPGGKVEFGEEPNHALTREIKEETGLEITAFFPIKCTHYMIEKPEKKRHTIQIIYLTNTTNPTNVQLSTEHSQFQWIAINELNQLDTFEDVPAILQEARKRLENLKE